VAHHFILPFRIGAPGRRREGRVSAVSETRRYVILGAGRQGTAAGFLLGQDPTHELVLADIDEEIARQSAARLERLGVAGRVSHARVDVSDEAAVTELVRGAAAVLSAAPYRFNLGITRACLAAGAGLCDLGGNTGVVRAQLDLHEEARRAGVAVVPDCGLAPGLANTLAAACLEHLDETRSVRLYCGGLPQRPRPPLGYHLVFDMEGLFNEYSGHALILREGRLCEIPALSEREELELPGVGRVEAFSTSGGSSTAPWSFEGKLQRFEYKTVRYPGHLAALRRLVLREFLSDRSLGELGGETRPRDLLGRFLRPLLDSSDDPDLVVLRVTASGLRGERPATITFDMLDRQDPITGLTAMERSTGFPAALVARFIGEGKVAPGAVPLELAVPPGPYLSELRETGLPLEETHDEV
jgi:lysine 6-dehydrogenase